MPDTWITDMTHYLDERGRIASMPGAARRIADYFGSIVVSMATATPETVVATSVACRRRPGHRPCSGNLHAVLSCELNIRWQCAACGDNGLISRWQGTPWDCRRVGFVQ